MTLIALLIVSYLGRDGGLFPQYFFCFELGILAYQFRDFVDARPTVTRNLQLVQPLAACLGFFMVGYAHSIIATWISGAVGTALDSITLTWVQVIIEGFGAAILVFGCSSSSLIVNALLGNRPLRFLGRISFSLYCTHLIILKAIFPIWVAVVWRESGDPPVPGSSAGPWVRGARCYPPVRIHLFARRTAGNSRRPKTLRPADACTGVKNGIAGGLANSQTISRFRHAS